MQGYYWFEAEWRDGYLYAMTSIQTGFMAFSSYLWRIEVRDPARPTVLGALEVPEGGESLSLGDRLAIVGSGSHKVVDQTDADQPRVAANLSDRWRIGEVVAGAGNLAVRSAAYGFDGAIEFIDLSDEHLPYRTGIVPLSGTVSARDIALQEHTAYAAVQERGVLVIDAADPSALRLLTTVSPVADLRAIVVDGATASSLRRIPAMGRQERFGRLTYATQLGRPSWVGSPVTSGLSLSTGRTCTRDGRRTAGCG